MSDRRAADLEPGDRFPVGGITRTVTDVEFHPDGNVTVTYEPGTGLRRVSPDLRIRHAS